MEEEDLTELLKTGKLDATGHVDGTHYVAAVQTGSTVYLTDAYPGQANPTIISSYPMTNTGTARGIAMSGGTPNLVVVDGANLILLTYQSGANTMARQGTFPLPSGPFVDVQISADGNFAWVETTTKIHRYTLAGLSLSSDGTPTQLDDPIYTGGGGVPLDPNGIASNAQRTCVDEDTGETTYVLNDQDCPAGTTEFDDDGNPVGSAGGGAGTTSGAGDLSRLEDGGILKNAAVGMADAFGINESGGALMLCLIFVLFFATAGGTMGMSQDKRSGRSFGNVSTMGVALGAALGLAICVVLNLIGLLVVFIVTIICGAVVVGFILKGRGD